MEKSTRNNVSIYRPSASPYAYTDLQDRARAFHIGPEPPEIQHLIADL